MSPTRSGLTALCLAAGRGTRLAPITDRLPKALCPAGERDRLLSRAVARASRHSASVMVNAHHHAGQIVDYCAEHFPGVRVVVEEQLLGTGGAVGNVAAEVGGHDLMIVNSDTVLMADTSSFVADWDGERVRMLVVEDRVRPDFDSRWRYVGVCLVPNRFAVGLPADPSNLSEVLFLPRVEAGEMELVPVDGDYVDCAGPADLLRANLLISGGRTVVSDGAVLEGSAEKSLLMPGSRVGPGETLRLSIRTEDGATIRLEGEFEGPA